MFYNIYQDNTSPVYLWRETIGWRTCKRISREIYSHQKNIPTIYTAPAYALTKTAYFAEYLMRKKELLSLYNALNMSHYENPDDLEIITLDNALFLQMKNDVAFSY